ncbi:MAG: hypothetical protein ACREB5_11145 [Sphingomonadaceae bacterium]
MVFTMSDSTDTISRVLDASLNSRFLLITHSSKRDQASTWPDLQRLDGWGEARNAHGECKVARVHTANVYRLTIYGSLAVVEYLLQVRPAGGTYTPARLLGADLVTALPGAGALKVE